MNRPSIPRRIVHLAGARQDVGGVLSVIRAIVEGQREAGLPGEHLVVVHESYKETRFPSLRYLRSRRMIEEDPDLLKLVLGALLAVPQIRRLRLGPDDVIHAHHRGSYAAGIVFALLGKCRVVHTNHSYATRPWLYRLMARIPRLASVILTPQMGRHYGMAPADFPRLHLIPACGAQAFFEAPLLPAPPSGRIRLLGLGVLHPRKKWDLICEALAFLPRPVASRLLVSIYGGAPEDALSQSYAQRLRARIAELGLDDIVRLEDPVADVKPLLRDADWSILPSTDEPCSVSLIESLALGRPVLVSRSGGNIDLIREGETGLFFRPDDPADLARLLRRLHDGATVSATPEEMRTSVARCRGSEVASAYGRLYAGETP